MFVSNPPSCSWKASKTQMASISILMDGWISLQGTDLKIRTANVKNNAKFTSHISKTYQIQII